MQHVRELDAFDDCTLDLGGLAIGISVDASIDAETRRSLRHHFQPARLSAATPTRTIDVRCGPLPDPIDGPVLSSALGQDLRSVGGTTEIRSATTVARWNADDASLTIAPECFPEEVGYVVGMIAIELCSMAGIDALHAALIVGGQRSALVLGASGQGKSTTAGSALLAGLLVASDDAVLVRQRNGQVEGCGLPRTLAVPDEVGAGDGPLDHRGRVSVDQQDTAGTWHRIDELLVVGHGTASETSLEPLPHTDLLRELITANLGSLRVGGERQRSLALFASLGQRRRHRLALGADSERRPTSTGALLVDLLDGDGVDG